MGAGAIWTSDLWTKVSQEKVYIAIFIKKNHNKNFSEPVVLFLDMINIRISRER
jgi:hypothetical protein